MNINSKTYKIKEINYNKTQTNKTQILLATSLRKDNNHITHLQHKDFGKTKKWNTYTVSRNGIVYQHYDNKYYSEFIGIKEADKQSISIVMENMGCLFHTVNGDYINWINEVCNENDIVEKQWYGYNYWEQIPDIQLENVAELCNKICEENNIPKICIDFNHYHKDIIKFKGIVFRSNYVEDSSDMNPLFNIAKFNDILHNHEIK